MRTAMFASVAVLALGVAAVTIRAHALDLAPPAKEFVQGGETLRWSVAHGVTGGLLLSGPLRADGSNVDLVISCSGLRSGGIQARLYEPKPNAAQLRLRTADGVFRVYRGIETFGSRSFVEGNGDLPEGFFKSLAHTPNVSVEYAGQTTGFAGPGVALTEHFHRYCSSLARRAAADE